MKRKILSFLLFLVLAFGITACKEVKFELTFMVDDEIYSTISTSGEETIEMPENPTTTDGKVFIGWYWDKDVWQKPFTANSLLDEPLKSDMKVYARFDTDKSLANIVKADRFTFNEDKGFVSVSNSTTQFSFINEIEVSAGATWQVCTDITGYGVIPTKTVLLNDVGDNIFYIFVTSADNNTIKLYEITVRRRPLYTVSFNTNGGSTIASQTIEEGSLAIESTTVKAGYHYVWDYDFTSPITDDITINAVWTPNTDTAYKVEYYLQNLENDKYTLEETVNKTGTTDTTITAEIKNYPHFTAVSNTVRGNIGGDGKTILKVYYTRDKYTISTAQNNKKAGKITSNGTYKYDKEITLMASTNPGYTWLGWCDGENIVCETEIFTFKVTKNISYTATWSANTDTAYKVEYYLQNFENDKYTLEETVNKTGTTDTTVTAEIKNYPHFTAVSNKVSGNIDGDGGAILRVYYNLDKFTVTFDGNGGTLKSGSDRQTVKYGGSVVAPTFEKKGYSFTGYNKTNFTNISESFTVTANWKINQYTLRIVYGIGQEDKVITQDYNTPIEEVANPEMLGYEFVEWDIAIPTIMPAKNLTITAQWKTIFTFLNSTITGLTAYGEANSTEIVIPSSNLNGVPITSIASSAFSNCSALTSVTIPNSVTRIGDWAFASCSSLTSVVIPDSVKSIGFAAFSNCSSLVYNVKNGLKYLGNNNNPYLYLVGVDNTSITALNIDSNCKFIDTGNFSNCSSLLYNVKNGLKYLGNNNNPYLYLADTESTGITSASIDSNCKFIAKSAFAFCSSLTSIIIPDSLTSIGERAFYKCSSLTSVVIPDSVKNIGYAAFASCSSLTSVVIGDSVEGIDSYAFSGCSSLTSVVIGNSLTCIGDEVFSNCSSLMSITLPESLTSIGERAFYDCSSLTTITTLDNVTSIGNMAFAYCSSLMSVVMPDSITSIGDEVFYNCSSLMSITLPESLTSIGNMAFYDCSSLTTIIIPDRVEYIWNKAFSNCSGLTSVVIPDSIRLIDYLAFSNCTNLSTIYYMGTEEQWDAIMKVADWDSNIGNYTIVYNYKGE